MTMVSTRFCRALLLLTLAFRAWAQFDDLFERDDCEECTAGPITSNGITCQVSCGVDRPGYNYKQAYTDSIDDCATACAADNQCVTAQFDEDNGFCYFKDIANTASANPDVDTIDCRTASKCRAGSQTVNGRTCTTTCNADRPGGNLASSQTVTFQACVEACGNNEQCVTAQFIENNGVCYLKSSSSQLTPSNGVDTVDCAPVNNKGTSSSTSSKTSTKASTTSSSKTSSSTTAKSMATSSKASTTSSSKATTTSSAKVTTTSSAKITTTSSAKITTTSSAKITTTSSAKTTSSTSASKMQYPRRFF